MSNNNPKLTQKNNPGRVPEPPNNPFGKRIWEMMVYLKITSYTKVETMAGLPKGTISRYMRGTPAGKDNIKKLAGAFGCRPAWLQYGEGEPFPEKSIDLESSKNTDTKTGNQTYNDPSINKETQGQADGKKGSEAVPGDSRVSIEKDGHQKKPYLRSGQGIRIVSTGEGKALKIPESYELINIVSSAPMLIDQPKFTKLLVDTSAEIEDGNICWAQIFRGKHKGILIGTVTFLEGQIQIDDIHVPRKTIIVDEDDVDLKPVEGFL